MKLTLYFEPECMKNAAIDSQCNLQSNKECRHVHEGPALQLPRDSQRRRTDPNIQPNYKRTQ